MKPLALDSASIFLQAKSMGKYFRAFENHQKGQPALTVSLYKHIALVYTLDMGLDQLLPSKIHNYYSASNKITKF